MTTQPKQWTADELGNDAETSAAHFRSGRLALSDAWQSHYNAAHLKFDALLQTLGDLSPSTVTDDSLTRAYGMGLGDALRYLAGPPISDDDLQVIADVASLAPSKLKRDSAAVRKIFGVIERVIDTNRFPWVSENRSPTTHEREAALLASSVLLAAQRVATQRRNDGKTEQEMKVKAYLRSLGFTEASAGAIPTIVRGPQTMQFCGESMLGDRKADVVVRLHDTRLMAIECKVSNSSINSVKRLNNDAAAKAQYWIGQFGVAQVVPSAMLAGVFKVLNLMQAQSAGLGIFWSHDLNKMGEFIESTR